MEAVRMLEDALLLVQVPGCCILEPVLAQHQIGLVVLAVDDIILHLLLQQLHLFAANGRRALPSTID